MSRGYKQRGWICEKCQLVDFDMKDKCPNCRGNVSQVDVIEVHFNMSGYEPN